MAPKSAGTTSPIIFLNRPEILTTDSTLSSSDESFDLAAEPLEALTARFRYGAAEALVRLRC